MKNRLLALWGFTLLSMPLAARAQQSGDFTYYSDGSVITITGYTGSGGAVIIPDTITGLPVRIIGGSAFQNKINLTSVTLPASFTSIGNQAFYSCINLASVTIGTGVTNIGDSAFESCLSLTNVMIPASVTSIGYWTFNSCTNLSAITVDALNSVFSSADGVLFNKSQTQLIMFPGGKAGSYTIPNSVTSLEYSAFRFCSRLRNVTIPNTVTNMGAQAFAFCTGLTNVTVPNSVTSIEFYAFGSCASLISVTIPNSVTSIGGQAFSSCASLTNVMIPASITNIGGNAFENCASLTAITVDAANLSYSSADGVLFNKNQTDLLQCPGGKAGSYSIPGTVTNIEFSGFSSCTRLTSVTIPGSVISIGSFAFYSCTNLTSVTIGNGVTSIGHSAFFYCTSLTNVAIPASVTSIGGEAFLDGRSLSAITVDALNSVYSSVDGVLFNKSQTLLIQCPGRKAGSYTVPNGVTSIGDSGFDFCTSLTSVTIPNSVNSIGGEAFFYCTSLTNVTIGNGVTSIGELAFAYCTNLTGVYFQGNAPSDGFDVFMNAADPTVYYLPGTTGWGATFGDRPAVLWKPLVQTSDASFGVRTNRFGFIITWANNQVVVVEAATNLANPAWTPVGTNALSGGSSYFSDPQWTNYPTRFYRLRSP